MKLLGTNDDRNVARDQQPMQRSQDDATVGYVFQRSHIQQHEAEYVAQFAQKQQTRWASGDDHSLDVSSYDHLKQTRSFRIPMFLFIFAFEVFNFRVIQFALVKACFY